MKIKAKVGLAMVLGLAAGITAPSIAMADASEKFVDTIDGKPYHRSTATYSTAHNKVSSTDVRSDGWGSRAYWKFSDGGTGSTKNGGGYGTTATRQFTYQMWDNGKTIKVQSCGYYNSKPEKCGKYSGSTAI